jgi:F-box domain
MFYSLFNFSLEVIMDMQFDQDDHLSGFPDEILHRILSKMPFAEAVQSSILSHRWMHLWTGIPNVELKQKETEHLLEFLNRGRLILECHSAAPIEKLHFGIRNHYELLQHPDFSEESRDFVESAISNQVKEITLDFAMKAPGYSDRKGRCSCAEASSHYIMHGIHMLLHFNLDRLNGCPLHILKLKDCKIDISNYQNFASLETLWLTRVYPSKGTVQEMVEGLTSACTGLKTFILEFYLLPSKKCATLRVEQLKITCPKLENLTFKCCHCFESISVNAPKLKYFEFRGELHERSAFHLVNSPALVSATFIISRSGVYFPAYSGVMAAKSIGQFGHVKFMTIAFYDTKVVCCL